MATRPTPKPKYSKRVVAIEKNDPVTKALKFFFGDKTKSSGKKSAPLKRTERFGGRPAPQGFKTRPRFDGVKPAPMPRIKGTDGKQPLPLISGGRGLTPVPMPGINSGPRTRKPAAPAGPKKKSPGVVIKPRAKKKY